MDNIEEVIKDGDYLINIYYLLNLYKKSKINYLIPRNNPHSKFQISILKFVLNLLVMNGRLFLGIMY